MWSFRTKYAMMNSTTTMAIVSAVYCHARPRTKIKHMKIDKLLAQVHGVRGLGILVEIIGVFVTSTHQKVLFIEAAPSRADNDTEMVFLVFLLA